MSCKNKKIPSGLADSPLSGLDIDHGDGSPIIFHQLQFLN